MNEETSSPVADSSTKYKIGTLEYTKRGLFFLAFWLLWGDFCFTLMETVVPTLLPLQLDHLHASNKLISLVDDNHPGYLELLRLPVGEFQE
ncbi:MAG TPA: hypothetical protein VGK34_00300 [Armatimonadota bacterium]